MRRPWPSEELKILLIEGVIQGHRRSLAESMGRISGSSCRNLVECLPGVWPYMPPIPPKAVLHRSIAKILVSYITTG